MKKKCQVKKYFYARKNQIVVKKSKHFMQKLKKFKT